MSKAKQGPQELVKHLIAIDVEVAGSGAVGLGRVIEMGAAHVVVGEKKPRQTYGAVIECDLDAEGFFDNRAGREYWKSDEKSVGGKTQLVLHKERRAKCTVISEKEAITGLVNWCKSIQVSLPKGEIVVLITDTVAFDTTWINDMIGRHLPEVESLLYVFGEKRFVRATSSFYFGMGCGIYESGSKKVALRSVGLTDYPDWLKKFEHTHNPVDDAISIGMKFVFFLGQLHTKKASEMVTNAESKRYAPY